MKLIFSLYPEIIMIYLLIKYLYSKDVFYFIVLVIGIIIIISFGSLRYILQNKTKIKLPKLFYRPDDAFGCNTNIQKSNKGEIGMPSIHSIISSFYSVMFYQTGNPILFLYSIITPLTRLGWKHCPKLIASCESGCHTILQVVIGIIIGYLLGIYF